jgi:NADPH:quinone reductase-like Zn-dependent oxidoreductase
MPVYDLPQAGHVSAPSRPAAPNDAETMQAIRLRARSGPDGLVKEEAPIPEPGIGDVLVRVGAASFTPTELAWPSTWVDRTGRDRMPVIPAHEVCGTVVRLGYGTAGLEVGDAVYGLTDWYRDGAAAEYVAVEARNLAPRPAALDEAEAAAVPMPALTASQALFTHGALTQGQTVLVLGAAGGVGTFAVQLARLAGARVLAGARSWARDRVLELGAQEFVHADQTPMESAVGNVDLVFDLVGGDTLGRWWSAVRPGGSVVSVVEDPAARPQSRNDDVRSVFFVVEPNGAALHQLGARLADRTLRPVVGEIHPLVEGRDAFESKQSGRIFGKNVLRVA